MALFSSKKIFCIFQLFLYFNVSVSSVIVDSPFGKIQGDVISGDSDDQSLVVFRNIPYAKPPVGELRFAKPEPHPKIDGIFDATNKNLVMCLHPDAFLFGREQGSEDCLILNIYAKNVNSDKLKKVIVFIHGGGFVAGSAGFYNMSSFIKTHDVIGITINYRLGILGFLSFGNDVNPGNYGLWDQAMALQWIKDNIKAFGGDPNDITISGESAGGASVAYLSLSPVTKGLFSKAFPQSGSATSVFGQAIDVKKRALTIAKSAKCWDGEITDNLELTQSRDVMTCLRTTETSVFTSFVPYSLTEPQFVPTVDGEFVPKKPLLLLNDESYLESIGFYDRSYLVSMVNNEFAIMNNAFNTVLEWINGSNETNEEEKKQIILKLNNDIKILYTQSRLNKMASSASAVENMVDFYTRRYVGNAAVVNMVSDLTFIIPSYDFLNAASKQKRCHSWFLYFNYYPAFMRNKYKGTAHAVDLLYWFDITVKDMNQVLHAGMEGEMEADDLQLKTLYSAVIAGFVKQGDPGAALKELGPSGWPVYEPEGSYYLNFNLEPSLRSHLEREKRDFWMKKLPEWTVNTHRHTEL